MLAFAMAAEFTTAQVAAIAALAQLELEAQEVQLFARQLGDFLGYADEVLAIDTAGVAPTAYVVTSQESERPDQLRPSLDREAALRAAPDASLDTGFFRVPRVIG
jgi:aspartyl-tRNA(Asn)/glutamyl-tRNA(Gln) amidotransferase subunit C